MGGTERPPAANALVIDAKPGKQDTLIFRVRDVWGYSGHGWTPVLLRLQLVSEGGLDFKRELFVQDRDDEVFTISHMAGSVEGGRLVGTWNWPSVGSTNSTFLWPAVLGYFAEKMGLQSVPTATYGGAMAKEKGIER